jgi:hypothetical protein
MHTKAMTRPDLNNLAVSAGITWKGVLRPDLVTALVSKMESSVKLSNELIPNGLIELARERLAEEAEGY